MKTITSTIFVCMLLLSAACDSNQSTPELDGRWSGTTVIDGLQISITVLLSENNGVVNGNGTLTADQSFAVIVAGTHEFPNVSLTLSTDVFETLSFSGTMTSNETAIAGSLSGAGLQNVAIELHR